MCAFILTYMHIHVCDRQHTVTLHINLHVCTYIYISQFVCNRKLISLNEMRMSMYTSKERRGEYGIFLRLYSMGYKQAA